MTNYQLALKAQRDLSDRGFSRAALVGAPRSMMLMRRRGGVPRLSIARNQKRRRMATLRQRRAWTHGATRQAQYKGNPNVIGPVVYGSSYGIAPAGAQLMAEGGASLPSSPWDDLTGMTSGLVSGPNLGDWIRRGRLGALPDVLAAQSPGKLAGAWVLSFLVTWGLIEVLPPYLHAKLSSKSESERARAKFRLSIGISVGVTVLNQIVLPLMATNSTE